MGSGYYALLVEQLKKHGCTFKRQAKGSHEIWVSPISGKSVTVAVTVTSRMTANAILKQAGIDHKL